MASSVFTWSPAGQFESFLVVKHKTFPEIRMSLNNLEGEGFDYILHPLLTAFSMALLTLQNI